MMLFGMYICVYWKYLVCVHFRGQVEREVGGLACLP